MKKQNKRIISLIMALVMCLTLLPAAAFAVDIKDTSGLQDLIDDAAAGSTVTLNQDYALTAPVTIDKAVTIDGTSSKYSISFSGTETEYPITINSTGVTLQNLTITSRNGVSVAASGAKIVNCDINASRRGVNFYLGAAVSDPTLEISGTAIKNTNVNGQFDTTADYGADNRGVATGNIKGGTVTITNSQILGFKYSINVVVDAVSDTNTLRDGEGTKFNVSGTTVKGWTALNMWSANTTFNFTECDLVGINTFNDGWNEYGTIVANSGIYGGNASKASTINFVGGSVTAKQYGTVGQANFMIGSERLTKITFKYSGTLLKRTKVQINTDVIPGCTAAQFAFTGVSTTEQQQTYLNTKVSGMTSWNVDVNVGTLSAPSAAFVPMAVNDRDEFEMQSVAFDAAHTGGAR